MTLTFHTLHTTQALQDGTPEVPSSSSDSSSESEVSEDSDDSRGSVSPPAKRKKRRHEKRKSEDSDDSRGSVSFPVKRNKRRQEIITSAVPSRDPSLPEKKTPDVSVETEQGENALSQLALRVVMSKPLAIEEHNLHMCQYAYFQRCLDLHSKLEHASGEEKKRTQRLYTNMVKLTRFACQSLANATQVKRSKEPVDKKLFCNNKSTGNCTTKHHV